MAPSSAPRLLPWDSARAASRSRTDASTRMGVIEFISSVYATDVYKEVSRRSRAWHRFLSDWSFPPCRPPSSLLPRYEPHEFASDEAGQRSAAPPIRLA